MFFSVLSSEPVAGEVEKRGGILEDEKGGVCVCVYMCHLAKQ